MNILKIFKRKPKRLSNIVVYYLSSLREDERNNQPLGFMPRLTDKQEALIRTLNSPPKSGSSYVNSEVHGETAIVAWVDDKADAVAFLSEKIARSMPNLTLFTEEDLRVLAPGLKHYP